MVFSIKDSEYRQCSVSLMDNVANPDITFDENGISNYFYEYKTKLSAQLNSEEKQLQIKKIVETLKRNGRGKPYDCMVGLSGGVDSSYLCYLAWKLGLRVLCVHFDNGWNSELAVDNVHKIVEKCGFDLYTYVINWNEFRDIQIAYFKAGVIDLEAPTDIGIFNSLTLICIQKNIKYILIGDNLASEGVGVAAWSNKNPNNLIDIHQKFGSKPLKEFPIIIKNGRYIYYKNVYSKIRLLDLFDYNVKLAKQTIIDEFNWRDYGGKHYESIFTRFYQGYILPEKFQVDKRKMHLSSLIFSGQISKEEASLEMKNPIYPEELLHVDKDYVIKKLGMTSSDFEEYMESPVFDHGYYYNEPPTGVQVSLIRRVLSRFKQLVIN
jgi:N-acetyl sugar amidotransferase